MSRGFAPIALFCFNRPQHLARTLEALMACPEFEASALCVYADGPRHDGDQHGVDAVREVLAARLPSSATVVARPSNIGLARSIIEGVGSMCDRYGRVIVLEDDLLLDSRFLGYMNSALDRYEHQDNVFQVAGHTFESPALSGRREAIVLPMPSSWGWATWQRAWRHFDADATGWQELARNREMRRRFNFDQAYDYTTMLERQMHGELHSWAIRWYWSVFRAGGLSVYPPFNLVDNIGMDGSGTHGRGRLRNFGRPTVGRAPAGPIILPDVATLDDEVCRHVRDALWRDNGRWLGRSVDLVRRALWLGRKGRRAPG